jgi:beta-galactosidase
MTNSTSALPRRDFLKLSGLAMAGLSLPTVARGNHAAFRSEKLPASAWDRYKLGSSYYPEWWDETEWEKDFRQMHDLGFNTVRMGEFAWAAYEPSKGRFSFQWMDRAIARANHYGIQVILATPTASVPPWLRQAHHDVLGGNEKGPYTYGGRKGYCTNSPAYLQAAASITEMLAKHYGRHSGVIGWQLDNEPGFPFVCYDANCQKAFQLWLKKRYGSLDALNRTWNGAFWSNHFTDWSQIEIPFNSAEGGWQPGISLDYRRFFSDSFLAHLRRQAEIICRHSTGQFIFTNWPNLTWSVNPYTAATEFLDATGWDNYVGPPGVSAYQDQYRSGFHSDFARCAGPHQRFLCAEKIAYVPANARPEGLRVQAYNDLAHGSHGTLYFEWRRPQAGNEEARPSRIVRFDGSIPDREVFARIGSEFARLGPLLAQAKTRADVAMLYDFTNEWSQGFWGSGRGYDGDAERYYRGFKVLQRNLDILRLTADLSAYKLVVAPNLRLVDDATVDRLRAYVADGGILVLNFHTGTQNLDNSMRPVLPPGPFTEMAGVTALSELNKDEYSAMGTLDPRHKDAPGIAFSNSKTLFAPRTMMENLRLEGAVPVATFHGGRMDGRPAITRHQYKKGFVFYSGTDSSEVGFYETLAREAAVAGRILPLLEVPVGVEVATRETHDTTYYFLLNYTETTHEIHLPRAMDELVSQRKKISDVSLTALGVAVLAERR